MMKFDELVGPLDTQGVKDWAQAIKLAAVMSSYSNAEILWRNTYSPEEKMPAGWVFKDTGDNCLLLHDNVCYAEISIEHSILGDKQGPVTVTVFYEDSQRLVMQVMDSKVNVVGYVPPPIEDI